VDRQLIWKTDDPSLTARLRRTFNSPEPQRKVPLDLLVQASVGRPWWSSAGRKAARLAVFSRTTPLAAATQRPVTEELLRTQLGRLGRSVYQLRRLGSLP